MTVRDGKKALDDLGRAEQSKSRRRVIDGYIN